jgi:dihydroorotase
MLELVEAGCVAASDDGRPVASAEVMRRALEYSLAASIPVISHAEDLTLRGKGVMNEGFVSTTLGLKGIPNACEDVIVAREVLLAKLTGARVHIAHVSTRKAVQIVSRAKEDGLHVTAEASPHHLALTDEAVRGYDTHAKMNPPLRTEQDRLAVVHGLANGTIDAIATDHAPHAPVEKEVEFDVAPFGVIGLETAVGVVLTDLVAKGLLSLSRAIEAWTAGPARVLGRPAPELKVGAVADVTVLAPDRKWTVDPFKFHSKSRNSPFVGRELTGMAVLTILEGRITHEVPGLRGGTGARSRGNGGRVAVGKALR